MFFFFEDVDFSDYYQVCLESEMSWNKYNNRNYKK